MPDPTPHPASSSGHRAFTWRELGPLAKQTVKEFAEDKTPRQAAALAYYVLFAIGPLILLVVGVAGLVFGVETVRQVIIDRIASVAGPQGGQAISDMVVGAQQDRSGVVGALLGLAILLVAAGAAFKHLKDALNDLWEVRPDRPEGIGAKVAFFVRNNAGAFLAVLGVALLLMLTLAASALIPAFQSVFGTTLPGGAFLWQVLHFVVAAALLWGAFALVFKYVPDVRIGWRDVAVGAGITAVLFVVGEMLLGWYLGSGSVGERYGAGSAIVVVLVWIYYSAIIVFLGAQFTQVYANRYGGGVRPDRNARPLQEAIAEEQSRPSREGTRAGRRERGGAT